MPKTIEKTKAALKLRTSATPKILTLKVKGKKHVLPIEARLIESDEYVFIHIPPTAEIFQIMPDGLKMVTTDEGADAAVAAFRKARRRQSGPEGKGPIVPPELASILSKIPAGYKLGYGADGSPKLIKTRRRNKG